MPTKWDELDEYFSKNTPAIVGEVVRTPEGISRVDLKQLLNAYIAS
jgi:hypothetical protein